MGSQAGVWGPQAGAWGPQARAVKTLWVLGGSEAQTHVGTEEPDRPSHEGLGGTRRAASFPASLEFSRSRPGMAQSRSAAARGRPGRWA